MIDQNPYNDTVKEMHEAGLITTSEVNVLLERTSPYSYDEYAWPFHCSHTRKPRRFQVPFWPHKGLKLVSFSAKDY